MKAKDQQAAEANKNASILLKELDLEKVSRMSILLEIKFIIWFINLLAVWIVVFNIIWLKVIISRLSL